MSSSKKTISAGIGIDGEKAFKQAISDINSNLSVLKTEMKLVTATFTDNADSQEALTAKQKVLSKQIEEQKSKISTLESALENAKKAYSENTELLPKMEAKLADARKELEKVSAEFGENSDEAKAAQKSLAEAQKGYDDVAKAVKSSKSTMDTWQKSLNTAKTDLLALNKELDNSNMDEFKDSVDSAEKELSDFSKETDNAKDKTAGFGDAIGKVGDVVKAGAAAATAAIASIGTVISAVVSQMSQLTVESAAYADEIITASTVTGMSKESLQAYTYAAELVDVSLDTLTGSMAKQVKSMSSAADGSVAYAEAYKLLGVSVTDSNGKLRDSETVYWETIDALGKIENETERDSVAMQLFGKSAQDLNPLIQQGAEGIATLTEEAKSMGAVMSDDTLNALGAFDDSMQRLTAGGSAAKNALGTLLLPQLQILSDEGVSLIGNFTNGILEADGDWSKIGDVISETIESGLNVIDEQLPMILDTGSEIIMSLIKGIADNSDKILDVVDSIMDTFLSGGTEILPELLIFALDLVVTIADGIIDNLPLLLTTSLEIITSLANGIADSLPELTPTIVGVVLQIAETLTEPDTLVNLLDASLQIILALADGLIESIPEIVDKIPVIIENLISAIIRCLPLIMEAGVELILSLIEGVVSTFGSVIQTGADIVDKVKSGFADKIGDAKTWGKDMIQNFIDGITEKWQALKDKVSEVAQTVKDFLGFSEPKEGPLSNFHTYSPDMIDLFIQGIQDNEYKLRDQMNKSLSFDVGRIDGQIAAAQPSAQMTAITYSQAASTDSNLMLKMIELLTVIASNSNRPIVLDSGAVVGGIIDNVDTQLGYILANKQRG